MPKLLLIAGYFPPVRISVGSLRPWNLAKYLTKLGWDVTVMTPKIEIWNGCHLDDIDQVNKDIRLLGIKMIYTGHVLKCLAPTRYKLPQNRFFWFFGGLLRVTARYLGIENWVGWIPSAINAGNRINKGDYDIILSTGAPFSGFLIANLLSKKLDIPYIVDYRDLWTNSPWHTPGRKWVKNCERKLLLESSAATFVSPLSGEILSQTYNIENKVQIITNGYDEDINMTSYKHNNHFTIMYSGMLTPTRELSPLFKALYKLQDYKDCPDWKFYYFGPNSIEVTKQVAEYSLLNKSVINGNIPRKEVLPLMKSASLNVIISATTDSPTIEDKGVIPGKVFELIGLDASILSIVPKDSAIESILSDVGIQSFSPKDTLSITNYIIERMHGKQTKIINKEKYSWNTLSMKFDSLLRNIVNK